MQVERVQYIASNLSKESETTIPSDYIRSEKEQPAITTLHGVVLEVPVIDLRSDKEEKEEEENLVHLVSQASREWGIFQVVNHGIPEEVITKLQEVGKHFFEVIPQEEKEEIAKPIGGVSKTIEGYGTSLQKDGKKGWVDHLFHIIWPPSSVNYKFWPKNPPSYREANEEYCKRLRGVSDRLFKYLSLGIGLEENEFKESLGGEELIYLMKINYYPPCPRPDLVLGVAPHTDASSFTILVPNEIQGLQVFKNDNWYDVKYIPNALIVHIGDQIEIISNGKYKSVLHRTTVNKEKTRMSWPVFLEPPPEKEIGPNPKLVDEEEEEKKKDNGGKLLYKTKKYKDYLYCKLNKIPQ